MGTRLELHALLKTLTGSDNVYFQPPPGIQMSYPCVVYNLDDIRSDFADNKPVRHKLRYSVTWVDPNPDSQIPIAIAGLPTCSFDRAYVSENLNHYAFHLFF